MYTNSSCFAGETEKSSLIIEPEATSPSGRLSDFEADHQLLGGRPPAGNGSRSKATSSKLSTRPPAIGESSTSSRPTWDRLLARAREGTPSSWCASSTAGRTDPGEEGQDERVQLQEDRPWIPGPLCCLWAILQVIICVQDWKDANREEEAAEEKAEKEEMEEESLLGLQEKKEKEKKKSDSFPKKQAPVRRIISEKKGCCPEKPPAAEKKKQAEPRREAQPLR